RLLVRPGFAAPGLTIYLLGRTLPELGGSEFAEVVLGTVSGTPPSLDLASEARLHAFLRECSLRDLLASSHDLSDGGQAVGLADALVEYEGTIPRLMSAARVSA